MPPALSPLKATTQLSILEYCSPRSTGSPARSSTANSPDRDRQQASTKRSLLLDSASRSNSRTPSRRSPRCGVARKQYNEDDEDDDESMQEDGREVSEDDNSTPATPPRRSQHSPSLSSSRQNTRKDDFEEEDSDEDDNDKDDEDEIMLDAKDTGDELEQEIALAKSGMFKIGTVVTKQFEEGWFTGKVIRYSLIDDDTYPYYHVLYEDGDEEDLTLSEIEELFKAAAEKRNAIKEPAKKKRKMTAKVNSGKKAAKANRSKKPSNKKVAATSTSDKRAAAKPKAAPSNKKGAATSTSDKRAAAKPKAAPSKEKDAATSTSNKRNVLKVPYSGGDGLEIIAEPQAMFDDMIDTKLTDKGEKSEILIPLVKALKNRTLRVATMCSGTESPILALDMLQKSIRKHCSTHLSSEMEELGIDVESLFQIEHVFSCEIEPFKQAYIERNFHPPLLFRDIRELGEDKAHTAYGSLVDVPNTPGCVDMLIAGTSCVDYSNLNNRKVSELQKVASSSYALYERF
jgi:hypothetical protein